MSSSLSGDETGGIESEAQHIITGEPCNSARISNPTVLGSAVGFHDVVNVLCLQSRYRPIYSLGVAGPCMTFEDPEGFLFWINEKEIVDIHKDVDTGHWTILASWGELYDISNEEDPRHVCNIIEERQRLLYLDLIN